MFLFFVQQKAGNRKGGSAAEENSPVDCFRRRGRVGALHRSDSPMGHQKSLKRLSLGDFYL